MAETQSEGPEVYQGRKTVVTLPTYNESENIGRLVAELRSMGLDVLVADDDSPDGTHEIVGRLAADDPGVHLLLRKGKRGRGLAGAEAFASALAMNAERIVEMDADLSHRPADLPRLLRALDDGADVAVGSRFVHGGRDERPSKTRKALTRVSTAYARWILKVPVRDCNSGFRAFTAYAMELVDPRSLISVGPSIVHEVLLKAHRRGLSIVEVPIEFAERARGKSALSFKKLLDGFFSVLKFRRLAAKGRLWVRDVETRS